MIDEKFIRHLLTNNQLTFIKIKHLHFYLPTSTWKMPGDFSHILVCVFQELVSEKLQTQQMNNDLEKLTHELEKIGLNKERLLHDENSDDRYHPRIHFLFIIELFILYLLLIYIQQGLLIIFTFVQLVHFGQLQLF